MIVAYNPRHCAKFFPPLLNLRCNSDITHVLVANSSFSLSDNFGGLTTENWLEIKLFWQNCSDFSDPAKLRLYRNACRNRRDSYPMQHFTVFSLESSKASHKSLPSLYRSGNCIWTGWIIYRRLPAGWPQTCGKKPDFLPQRGPAYSP